MLNSQSAIAALDAENTRQPASVSRSSTAFQGGVRIVSHSAHNHTIGQDPPHLIRWNSDACSTECIRGQRDGGQITPYPRYCANRRIRRLGSSRIATPASCATAKDSDGPGTLHFGSSVAVRGLGKQGQHPTRIRSISWQYYSFNPAYASCSVEETLDLQTMEVDKSADALEPRTTVRSCTTCSKAKAKCVRRPGQEVCERYVGFAPAAIYL